MPAIIPLLIGALLEVLASAAGRILLALGLSFITFKGVNVAINFLEDAIRNNMSAMPGQVVSFLAWCWVDKAISMMFSTYSVCMTFKMAGSTVLRKLVQKA